MPARKSRLLEKLTGGVRVGAYANHADIGTDGFYASYGTARHRKKLFIAAEDFLAQEAVGMLGGASSTQGGNSGSLMKASALFDFSGSVFAGLWQGSMPVPVLSASSASSASAYGATAVIPVPPDADTSGSIVARVHWTVVEDLEGSNASETYGIYGAIGYMPFGDNAACAVRTAACTTFAGSYDTSASGEMITTCLPAFPSFGATDDLIAVLVGWDPSSASAEGSASHVGIVGVTLEYTANAFGGQSAE